MTGSSIPYAAAYGLDRRWRLGNLIHVALTAAMLGCVPRGLEEARECDALGTCDEGLAFGGG
jgi:hypothetical protein